MNSLKSKSQISAKQVQSYTGKEYVGRESVGSFEINSTLSLAKHDSTSALMKTLF
jgi:hypothetical protein